MHPDGDTYRCDYCKSVYVPGQDDEGVRILGDPSDQDCPVCNVPLMPATLARLHILTCTKCRGLLVSMAVFPTLIDALRVEQDQTIVEPPGDPSALRRTIACPHCHQPMEAHFYAGPGNVIIDSCEPCLINWLDHGELTRIAHAPDSLREADADQ
jgi:Zn-finger nucleic acid-binding protein